MDYSFFDFLRLIGSLGLFLYGMKIMSEGLQKFAGDSLRRILTAMTTNRVTGVLTGVLITALIQSSSATTVMVVSFVNAGLLTLTQSIGVIMGAKFGTTVTAWLISALGFKVDIAAFSLPLLAFGIPLLFSGKSSRKSVGEFIFGFSFLFMGLQALKANAPDLGANPEMLAFVQNYADMGFFSIILFLFIGAILTMIVQASAATMAITLIMCANVWIVFQLGVALVLCENIGTTITANLAALTGNTQARRAALAHLAFNIFGVIWVLILSKVVTGKEHLERNDFIIEKQKAELQRMDAAKRHKEEQINLAEQELKQVKSEIRTDKLKKTATTAATAITSGVASLFGSGKLKELERANEKLQDEVSKRNTNIEKLQSQVQQMQKQHDTQIHNLREMHRQELDMKEKELSRLARIIDKAFRWFPMFREMLRMEKFCAMLGFSKEMTESLIVKKEALKCSGKIYSEQHRRNFDIKDDILRVENDPDDESRLNLTINRKPIADWFREQWHRLRYGARVPQQEERKSRGFKL